VLYWSPLSIVCCARAAARLPAAAIYLRFFENTALIPCWVGADMAHGRVHPAIAVPPMAKRRIIDALGQRFPGVEAVSD